MPRPTKAFRRMKINAAAEWKKGNRKEALALWKKAADGYQKHREKKLNKNKPEAKPEGEPKV